ncbi:hypothetical protein DBZ36_04770 [Alginatibacterium sediminis]|uniref:TRAP transporter small permease n=1 Tax=Alginatibacterium sediminis TaxID=2164068 RepID=A0A420EGI3_9ALTE|nr:hypothetical protein [Alginatibacterium sediminis]RKF19774.1 hypothetical protein DBZ36_04770 [Alginatibacterium sediminis]
MLIWNKIKSIVIIALVIVIPELIRFYTGLPITIIDLVVFPVFCLLLYFITTYVLDIKRSSKLDANKVFDRRWKVIGFLIFSVAIASMGIWLTWLGVQQPLTLFSSAKGAAHGYTLVQLGVITTLYSVGLSVVCSISLIRTPMRSS